MILTLSDLPDLMLQARGRRGLREVAREIGTSAATLSRVENYAGYSVETMILCCRWLGVIGLVFRQEVAEVMEGTE